jgi:hypothetical protein
MSDLEYQLARRQKIAVWSDRWQSEAARFADSHRDLLPRRITNAQLYGLGSVVRNARRYADIEKFIQHQAEKAGRAGRLDVQAYWSDLETALGKLRGEAQALLKTIPLPVEADGRQALDALHRELAGLYVQHLITHSVYWTPDEEEHKRRKR